MLTPSIELYGLSLRPAGKYNVARGHPDVAEQLRAIMARAHVPHPTWKPPARAAAK